jgi:hypothetical protein
VEVVGVSHAATENMNLQLAKIVSCAQNLQKENSAHTKGKRENKMSWN